MANLVISEKLAERLQRLAERQQRPIEAILEEMAIHFAPQAEPAPVAQVTVDPEVHGGVPCVGAGRWPIAYILEKLASGLTIERLIRDYPDLTLADVQLALAAAAWVMREPAIDWAELKLPEMIEFQREMQSWQGLSDDAFSVSDDLLRD